MNQRRTRLLVVACVLVSMGDQPCSADPQPIAQLGPRKLNLPKNVLNYSKLKIPKHLQNVTREFDNQPIENVVTNHGATLGRVLFYDKTLSQNGQRSCADCHKQEFAFTDDARLSIGFAGKAVDRNSMSLVNVRYYPNGRMFWDERAATLEEQVLMPIENHIEMGHRLPALVKQLSKDPLYTPLFTAAFGDATVSANRIANALAQFVRSIVSFRSKYDIGRAQVTSRNDPFPNFSEEENYGKEQFFGRARCAECHMESHPGAPQQTEGLSDLFYVTTPTVNGIDNDEAEDTGVGRVSNKANDRGRFKVPSLRNIEVTGPYMHDGRFHTLDQVIEHYNWSVKPHPNLDSRLADFAANGLALPEREKVALTMFLRTLTDRSLLSDFRFSDPFIRAGQE